MLTKVPGTPLSSVVSHHDSPVPGCSVYGKCAQCRAPVRVGICASCFLTDRAGVAGNTGDHVDWRASLLKIGFLSLVSLQSPGVPLPLASLPPVLLAQPLSV